MDTMSHRPQGNHAISWTQFMLLFWGGLLAPLVESLIPVVSPVAEGGAFLTPLLALPCLLLWGYIIWDIAPKGGDFSQGIMLILGKYGGTVLLTGYFLWGIYLLAVQLRLCAVGFLTVGYNQGSLYFLLPSLALFVFWMSGSKFSAFARSTTLFVGILMLVLAFVLLFSLPETRWIRVFPLLQEDVPRVGYGTVGVLGLWGYGIYNSFFLGEVVQPRWKQWCFWSILASVGGMFFLFVVTAVYGSPLLHQLDQAFYQLAKGITVEGGFQRIEGVVQALWTLADFILLGVLLRGASVCGKMLSPWKYSRGVMAVSLVVASVLALCYPALEGQSQTVAVWGNLVFGWIVPLVLFLLKKGLQREKNYGILEQSS